MITAYSSIFAEKLNRLETRLERMSRSGTNGENADLRTMLEAEAGRLRRVLDAVETEDPTGLAA